MKLLAALAAVALPLAALASNDFNHASLVAGYRGRNLRSCVADGIIVQPCTGGPRDVVFILDSEPLRAPSRLTVAHTRAAPQLRIRSTRKTFTRTRSTTFRTCFAPLARLKARKSVRPPPFIHEYSHALGMKRSANTGLGRRAHVLEPNKDGDPAGRVVRGRLVRPGASVPDWMRADRTHTKPGRNGARGPDDVLLMVRCPRCAAHTDASATRTSCTPTAEAFNLALQMFTQDGKNQIKVAYVITDGYRAPSAAPSLRTGN